MSPLGDGGDHSHLMVKHVDAQNNDTGHSVLLLKERGQGEKSQLELVVVKHLDIQFFQNFPARNLKNNSLSMSKMEIASFTSGCGIYQIRL